MFLLLLRKMLSHFLQESAPLLSKRAFNSASHESLMSEITFDAASLKLSHLVVELNNSWPWHRGCRKSRVALDGTLIFHVIGLCDAVRLNGRSTWMTRLTGAGGNLINVKSSLSSPKRYFSRAKNCWNVIFSLVATILLLNFVNFGHGERNKSRRQHNEGRKRV